MKKSEESLRDSWYTIKRNNIHITELPEGEEKKKKSSIFKAIMVESIPIPEGRNGHPDP